MASSRKRAIDKAPPLVEGNPVKNELLLGIPAQEWNLILPLLTFVQLRTHDVLQESEESIRYVYFVNSGMVSVVSVMQDGKVVEVGISGKEGCTGLPLLVGFRTSDTRSVVQIEGDALRMGSQNAVKALLRCPILTKRMQQYVFFMSMQSSQVAACNRLHDVEERLARWLLMSQDRVGGNLVNLTHELVAHMLGTRRSSVTVAAGLLSKSGLITYNRGHIKIESRTNLEDAACECYALLCRHSDQWRNELA